MFVKVAKETITLEDTDNFKTFYITTDRGMDVSGCETFNGLSEPVGKGHYWLDIDRLIQLSGRSTDKTWQNRFQDMLTKVEAYGFFDATTGRVKAHVE